MRGYTGTQGAVEWSLGRSIIWGPMVFYSATRGAIQTLRVLLNGLSFER